MSELLPCPFCGSGETQIEENGRIWAGTKYSDPISVSVRHWCDTVEGQPSRMIERIGRDRESAIAAWNRRASPATPAEDARDGERYRFRKSFLENGGAVMFIRGGRCQYRMNGELISAGATEEEAIDAAIDAALATQGEK